MNGSLHLSRVLRDEERARFENAMRITRRSKSSLLGLIVGDWLDWWDAVGQPMTPPAWGGTGSAGAVAPGAEADPVAESEGRLLPFRPPNSGR